MQKLHFLAATAVMLSATACPSIDPTDEGFDTILTTLDAEDDVDTEESGTDDATTEASTDADADADASTDADTTDDEACGSLGCACTDSTTCDGGLECINGTCQLPGSETTETTETTDTGDLGMCDPNNEYCLPNGCMGTMGQGLTLDTDMDGVADLGWCLWACENMDASMCPTLDGAQIQCVQWNMEGDQACFPLCQLANDTCPSGMVCYDAGLGMGVGICVSDAEGFG